MSGVFINYRRGEHTGAVEALHREVVRHFGQSQVFLDMPSIPLGDRYPDALRWRVQACEVLLVVIHAPWLTEVDEHGTRLIDRERDWVREEIEIALKADELVIPVLLGEARPPLPEDLPESIRDLALRQAHPIRQGSFGPDIEQLISRLEPHVAPTWLPPSNPAPSARRVPVRWLAGVTAVLAVALLVAPPVLLPNLADPSQSDLVDAVIYLTLLSVVVMAAGLVAALLINVFRVRINSLERETHPIPAARYNSRFAIPVSFIIVLLVMAWTVATSDEWRSALPLVLFILIFSVARAGLIAMRAEKLDDEDKTGWPRPLPSPFRATPAFRRVVEQFRTRVAGWKGPLSREQRDKSWWVLARLSDAVDELHTHARQNRLGWLTTELAWQACGYLLWSAGTVGLILATVFPAIYSGKTKLGPYAILLSFTLVIGMMCVGTFDMVYRYRRWRRERLAEEVKENIAELSERLLLDGVDHIPWDYVRDAYSPATEIPRLLRLVASGDEAAQQAAIDDLYDRLLHQDTVAEATVYSVPFLANLSTGRHLAVQARNHLVFLLARIAIAHQYFSEDGQKSISLTWNETGAEKPTPEPNWIRQARAAVNAAAPRLFKHLRTGRDEDAPSLVALAAAVRSAATPPLVSELEYLAERDHHALGAAAAITLDLLREETVPPAELLTRAIGNEDVTDYLRQALDHYPLPVVARKTAIELAAHSAALA